MNISTLVLAAACFGQSSAPLLAQVSYPLNATGIDKLHQDRLRLLTGNLDKLKVTVTLDRQAYLPGEAAQVKISVVNPTASSIEVRAPFEMNTASLWVLRKKMVDQEEIWEGLSAEPPCCANGVSDSAPTKWFAPGETVEQTFNSDDNDPQRHTVTFRIPITPGDYKLEYFGFGTEPAYFQVIAATVGLDAYVSLQRPGQYTEGRQVFQAQRRVPVVVLDADGKHYVVASRNTSGSPVVRDNLGNAIPGRGLSPYVRIATSDQPITSLDGVELVQSGGNASALAPVTGPGQEQESIMVRWTTQDGTRSSVNLGPDRRPIQ
jgi:hypothetical protein